MQTAAGESVLEELRLESNGLGLEAIRALAQQFECPAGGDRTMTLASGRQSQGRCARTHTILHAKHYIIRNNKEFA